jgi:hypothetical protein
MAPRRDLDLVRVAQHHGRLLDVGAVEQAQRHGLVLGHLLRLDQRAQRLDHALGAVDVELHLDPFDRFRAQLGDALAAAAGLDRQQADAGLLLRVVVELGRAHRRAADVGRQQAAAVPGEQHGVDELGLAPRELGDEGERHAVAAQALDQVVDAQRLLDVGDAVGVEPRPVRLDAGDHVRAPAREVGDLLFERGTHEAGGSSQAHTSATAAGLGESISTTLRREVAPSFRRRRLRGMSST